MSFTIIFSESVQSTVFVQLIIPLDAQASSFLQAGPGKECSGNGVCQQGLLGMSSILCKSRKKDHKMTPCETHC